MWSCPDGILSVVVLCPGAAWVSQVLPHPSHHSPHTSRSCPHPMLYDSSSLVLLVGEACRWVPIPGSLTLGKEGGKSSGMAGGEN